MNKHSPNMKLKRCLILVQRAQTIFNKKIDDMNKLFPNKKFRRSLSL